MSSQGLMPPRTVKAKICLVGEYGVGKSSLIRRYVLDEFDDRYMATIGAKITKKEVQVPTAKGETRLEMTIWDIMGEKGFRELLKEAYFEGCHGLLAVCDLTRSDTLFELPNWVKAVMKVSGQIPFLLLANKVDLEERIVLTEGDVAQMAQSLGAPHYLVSAKTGENVEQAFEVLARLVAPRRLEYHSR